MPLASVRGRQVYFESHGEGTGVPLVLVTGIGGSCRGWLALQVPAFSGERRTLIFDHRGVGESEDPGGPFTTADLADDLDDLLAALEVPRADVLGIFMGGMVAQELALRRPERVGRLVLVGTWARPDAKRRLLLEQWRDLARSGASLDLLIRERLLWSLGDETLEQRDLIETMIDYYKRGGAPFSADLFERQCEACLGHDTADRLGQIPHRALVICGRHDRLAPPRCHRQLADELSDAHLVSMGDGHVVMVESAAHFNHAVLQFLADER